MQAKAFIIDSVGQGSGKELSAFSRKLSFMKTMESTFFIPPRRFL